MSDIFGAQTDRVQCRHASEYVNDLRQSRHLSEKISYRIEIKQADQVPVGPAVISRNLGIDAVAAKRWCMDLLRVLHRAAVRRRFDIVELMVALMCFTPRNMGRDCRRVSARYANRRAKFMPACVPCCRCLSAMATPSVCRYCGVKAAFQQAY